MKATKEQVYMWALKALSEVDVADIACRMADANEKLDHELIPNDVETDTDPEPKDVSKALYALITEAIRRYENESYGAEIYVSPFYVKVDDDGFSIQYRPIDVFVSDMDT